ncbi:MAG: TetR/AcrR family transcriptional regulator [Lachnospiraceae bacterium]|nr:TetR/AcrR family transcriptional regulator [Lachnospiraceae bacterium]
MPRDKTENHEKIIDAAFKEFLEYGFRDASMRRIASASGMSAAGLYKHFPGKEDMFAALVDPVIKEFMSLYLEIENDYSGELAEDNVEEIWIEHHEILRAMEFIYDHYNEVKLIICRSQGTRYENFTHEVAELEEKATLKYVNGLKKKGIEIGKVNKKEFHLLVTTYIEAVVQAVIHDFSRKEAIHYAKTLEKFYLPAWKALFEIESQ